jgi:hypothetical protein
VLAATVLLIVGGGLALLGELGVVSALLAIVGGLAIVVGAFFLIAFVSEWLSARSPQEPAAPPIPSSAATIGQAIAEYEAAKAAGAQRAKAAIINQLTAPAFPRGRIEVNDVGYFDTDDGERLLLFGVKVTNREQSRRMNLELEFVLRMFTRIIKLNPDLKPLEMRLRKFAGAKNRPPEPLGVDPQDSPPELIYYLVWDMSTGLIFDGNGLKFHPELEGDAFVLRIRDLQSGGQIEIAIPGVWES